MIFRSFSNNAATFYNFQTGKATSLYPRYAAIVVFSAVLALVAKKDLSSFANLAVAILAIFVGFSFAILFFIISSRSQNTPTDFTDEEDLELEIER